MYTYQRQTTRDMMFNLLSHWIWDQPKQANCPVALIFFDMSMMNAIYIGIC